MIVYCVYCLYVVFVLKELSLEIKKAAFLYPEYFQCICLANIYITEGLIFFFFRTLTSAGKDLHDNFLKALAMREEDNRSGKVSVSTFHSEIKNIYLKGTLVYSI